jgi:hypothetical protein
MKNSQGKTGLIRGLPIGAAFELPIGAAFAAIVMLATVAGCAKDSSRLSFGSADEAVQALVAAARKDDVATLGKLFGPGSQSIIDSGDAVADAAARKQFVSLYDQKHDLVAEGNDRMVLQVGEAGWPLPVPVVRENGKWMLDGEAGADEVVFRRIGRNELGAIAVCHGYVDAQYEYASEDRDGEGAGVYAQKLVSDPGTHNGLYWPTAQGEPESPVGPFVAEAAAEGYRATGGASPYHGYRYRPLFRQGDHASGGPREYFENGVLKHGFALVAWPAEYGVGGVMTFIVNEDGVVFQKDLGPDTEATAMAMQAFDPDASWVAVVDEQTPGAGAAQGSTAS